MTEFMWHNMQYISTLLAANICHIMCRILFSCKTESWKCRLVEINESIFLTGNDGPPGGPGSQVKNSFLRITFDC